MAYIPQDMNPSSKFDILNQRWNQNGRQPSNALAWSSPNNTIAPSVEIPNSTAFLPTGIGASTSMANYPSFDVWNANLTANPTGGGFVGASPNMFSNGGWLDPKGAGGLALGAANVGIGAYNAWMGAKNQKFLQNYYQGQQDLQRADFANNAKSTNLRLEERFDDRMSNSGKSNTAGAKADYMKQWGVKETI